MILRDHRCKTVSRASAATERGRIKTMIATSDMLRWRALNASNAFKNHNRGNHLLSSVAAWRSWRQESKTVCDAGLESISSAISAHIPASGSFKLFKVVGDGACMFRAIVQGVQISTRGTPLSPDSETKAALTLRIAVVQELKSKKSEIEAFIPGILDGDLTWEDYLQRMSHPDAWGGEPEMLMAANIVRRAINVWRIGPEGNAELIVTYGEELLASGQSVNLLWHEAGHYDLLVRPGATE
ncbi:hypothetical protein CEUSTIGMA_g9807.t1 [Chlamydomonas eustigma]|uniref:Ubiquitin thioesterase OTU n=1 Tax=Chlamydomonas eustigma TaxID=1157962 RepID=A0A250XHI5_9CHLO|nr:hypothetical protein CEUSTIGMA_g9807.t1 [Chlamydomonas eustigma]|eukprot:GAX82379.1 hypothetical protein CEUSTIGMA_g9807.t1 [Chlamydomonas eustigma]